MFVARNKVRMHDTDMAGILYFAKQFRFMHDAWEDLMEGEGIHFDRMFSGGEYAFVIVHAEADYLSPLKVGDYLEVHVKVDKIGNTSFTAGYQIYREETLVGRGNTVHVAIDPVKRVKQPIPEELKKILNKYTQEEA
jgi:1,4-dihydroxy-2-naphthoyl-CoA hydrolase